MYDGHDEPRRRIGALTLLRNRVGDVLLVQSSYNGRWQLPGGAADQAEPPHRARQRELAEETGLQQPRTGALLLVDYTPLTPRSVEGLNLVFDGGLIPPGAKIALPSALPGQHPELTGYQFVPPIRLREVCQEPQARRIEAALAVLTDPRAPRYLVRSLPVDQQAER